MTRESANRLEKDLNEWLEESQVGDGIDEILGFDNQKLVVVPIWRNVGHKDKNYFIRKHHSTIETDADGIHHETHHDRFEGKDYPVTLLVPYNFNGSHFELAEISLSDRNTATSITIYNSYNHRYRELTDIIGHELQINLPKQPTISHKHNDKSFIGTIDGRCGDAAIAIARLRISGLEATYQNLAQDPYNIDTTDLSEDEIFNQLREKHFQEGLVPEKENYSEEEQSKNGDLEDDSQNDEESTKDKEENSDSGSSDSEESEVEVKKSVSNSLSRDLDVSMSRLKIGDKTFSQDLKESLETNYDDSSDEEDTKQKLTKYKSVEEAWENFSSPRVYYKGKKYPLTKQPDGNYKLVILGLGSWKDIDLSKHGSLKKSDQTPISCIYFGPEKYQRSRTPIDANNYRSSLFTESNYNKIKSSFELHYKGIQALYEDKVSTSYYEKKSKQLSVKDQANTTQQSVDLAIAKALNNLCLSVNWKGGISVGIKRLHEVVLNKDSVKEAFTNLATEVLAQRAISTRTSHIALKNLRPFSEAVYEEFFGSEDKIPSILNSTISLAIDELSSIGAVKRAGSKKHGYYYAAPNQEIRGKSYEELVNAKKLPKTKLGKTAWSIVKELNTDTAISDVLEKCKEHLLNDLIEDLSKLSQAEIDQKFSSLKTVHLVPRDEMLKIMDNLVLHNLSQITTRRKTFSDNAELVQESFADLMVNIRLSNRSQARRIKNLTQEEGDKVWSKTVTWAHAFEEGAQNHAIEKETVTTKAGRNSLILDFGKYEEGKRKGNTVTEGIEKLKSDLKIKDEVIAGCVLQILRGVSVSDVRNLEGDPIYPSETHSSILTNIAGLFTLEFKRNPNFTSFMILDLIKSGEVTWRDALDQDGKDGGMLPMSITDAMKSARFLHDLYGPYMPHSYQIQGEEKFEIGDAKVLDLITRESEVYAKWNDFYEKVEEARKSLQENKHLLRTKRKELKDVNQGLEGVKSKEELEKEFNILESEIDYYEQEDTEEAEDFLSAKKIEMKEVQKNWEARELKEELEEEISDCKKEIKEAAKKVELGTIQDDFDESGYPKSTVTLLAAKKVSDSQKSTQKK